MAVHSGHGWPSQGEAKGSQRSGRLSPRTKCQDKMKQPELKGIQSQGCGVSPGHGVCLSSRLWPATPTLSFLTLVQGSLEKLSVSEISMSSPYRTPVRSFLTCYKEKAVGGCAGDHGKDRKGPFRGVGLGKQLNWAGFLHQQCKRSDLSPSL